MPGKLVLYIIWLNTVHARRGSHFKTRTCISGCDIVAVVAFIRNNPESIFFGVHDKKCFKMNFSSGLTFGVECGIC